mgnify:CR=1 FL=1
MRFYCYLGPLKKGFKDACRPILELDGCHIKGNFLTPLLSIDYIVLDPNNGYRLVAWVAVEREITKQWK